jgi:hypothetical protein
MNDIALLGAEEAKATTVEAPVRCVRVYELPHRKTNHENEFGNTTGLNKTRTGTMASSVTVSGSERECVKGVWVKGMRDTSCAPCMGEMVRMLVRNASLFL